MTHRLTLTIDDWRRGHRNRRLANTLAKDLTWLWAKGTNTLTHTHSIGKHVIALTANLNEILLLPLPPPPPPALEVPPKNLKPKRKRQCVTKQTTAALDHCVCAFVRVCVFGARHVYSLAGANNIGIDPKPNPKTKPAPQRASASARAVKLSWRAVNLPPGQGLKHLHILLKDIERFQYLDRSTNTHTPVHTRTQPHTRTPAQHIVIC